MINELSTRVIDDWLYWLKCHVTADNLARKSFDQELKLLSVVLNCYKHERDYRFVVPIVRGHWQRARFKPVAVRPQDYYLRPEEVIIWLDSLAQRPDPVYHNLALLMVLTGLRIGEASGLCWDTINLGERGEQPPLRVIRTLSWDYKTKQPYFQDELKTGASIRTVPIEGVVVQMLAGLKQTAAQSVGSAPVFLNAQGKLLRDNTIRSNFNAAFKKCKLGWSGTHIARHTFATLALISERDIGSVQAALGHKSQQVTQGYAKVVALQTSRVSGNVARLIGITD